MSTTFYGSPDGGPGHLSIDVTHATIWFFEHGENGSVKGVATVPLDELPAIYVAIGEFLGVRP